MISVPEKKLAIEPLEIKCETTDCKEGFHCFKPVKGKQAEGCRECGIELVDWPRIHARDLADATHTLESMCREMIRYICWTAPFTPHALNYAKKKGVNGLQDRVPIHLSKKVGPAKIYRDGTQTGKVDSKNPIDLAQHASASCCRRCIEYWHAIPCGKELTSSEIDYLAGLVLLVLAQRLPNLTMNGERVAPIRAK